MSRLLRAWASRLSALGLVALPLLGRAQTTCATAACMPGPATMGQAVYGMGIYNVTLGSINNSTQGYTEGYQDFSCTQAATLPVSAPAAISVRNGTVTRENVRVWIDYDNSGTFEANELAFSSDNKLLHTGTLTPPATARLNTKLRLRVAADFADGTVPTPCSTPQYSQDEDYAVTLVANTSPPAAAFTADATTTCSGCVQLTDASTNGPSSWRWSFGDNTSSTEQNPQHCYAAAGTYPVTLTATNAAGSSTSAATTITYNPSVPRAATACPGLAATAPAGGYGIAGVALASISTSGTADGRAGYQDFTCPQRATLAAGVSYPVTITTSPLGAGATAKYDVRGWLDLNNDGAFSASEQVLEFLNVTNPTGTLLVPGTAVLNQPLRLRLVADGTGTDPQPCKAPSLGQIEDYTVTVVPNTSPPVAAFTSTYVAGACATPANTYTFTDQSTNAPTAWRWSFSPSAGVSFVNGTSAASANPQVAFANAGYYSVTLTATNSIGSNTLARSNYLLVQAPCLTYCASNGGTFAIASSFWITAVSVQAAGGGAAFSNATANSAGGYGNYLGQLLALAPGTAPTLSVTTNLAVGHRTAVWIDYNHDGVFDTSGPEAVYSDVAGATATATFPVAVPGTFATPTRMRIVVLASANAANPCATNLGQAEVEDYTVTPTQLLATRETQALPALTVSPNPTPDGQLRVQVSEASAAGRYSVEVLNLLGAKVLAAQLRPTLGAPATLSLTDLPTGLYLLRLTDERGQTALRRVARE